ncbi:MAG: RNA polymerase sigma factor SigZ [Phycisphaerales bacterium]
MTPPIESIWAEFAARLGRFIHARVADPATAEDILQDVFVRIHQRLDHLRTPAKLQSWLYLIARNAIIDHYRKTRKTSQLPESLLAEPPKDGPEACELKDALRQMIDGLPDTYREAIVLTEIEGLTQQELANRLGITLSGAKSRVQRARGQLKQMLLDCCHFEFDRRGGIVECKPRAKEGCPECSG